MLLQRPLLDNAEAPAKIATIVATLDGSKFSEKIIPWAVDIAKALEARLLLVQALAQQGLLSGSEVKA